MVHKLLSNKFTGHNTRTRNIGQTECHISVNLDEKECQLGTLSRHTQMKAYCCDFSSSAVNLG